MNFRAATAAERSRILLEGYLPTVKSVRIDCASTGGSSVMSRFAAILHAGSRKRTAQAFERDYPAMLLALASSIRTGLDPLTAMLDLTQLFPADSEISKELLLLRAAIDSGADEEEAIRSFGATIDQSDIRLFTTAFVLSRREGSSLAECLQRLARVTRQRQSFRRKIRSAVAMQKLSCLGISLSAAAIGVIQSLSNMKALTIALADPVGSRLLGAGAALILAGVLWMFKIATPTV